MKWAKQHPLLMLALVLGLVLRLPGWDSDDEKRRFVLFEADEIQHVDIAFVRYQQLSGDSLDHYFTPIFNVRGYGILTGTIAYGWSFIEGKPPTVGSMIRINRQVSTAFALLLILVVYWLGIGFGLKPKMAGIAALLLAFCDLNCSYSHYGIPAIGYVFGIYLTILGVQHWDKEKQLGILWMALGAAIAFSLKFDFIPLLIVGAYLSFKAWISSGNERNQQLLVMAVGLVTFISCLGMITGWSWSLTEMWDSWETLRRENQDVIQVDQHWLENPIVYLAAVFGGIGLFATLLALVGFKKLLAKKWTLPLMIMFVIISAEFLLRWSIDTPFVRRANFLMPLVALGAAYGGSCLRLKNWQLGLLVTYTLLLAIMGQSNHWFDTRSRARDWLAENVPPQATVAATPYAGAANSRKLKDYKPGGKWDYLLLHEAYTARYWKTFTTPFGRPNCCDEVYHCRGGKMCRSIQAILSGEDASVELVARFNTYRFFPERWLFHHFLGPYESFLGDALIYRYVGKRTSDLK